MLFTGKAHFMAFPIKSWGHKTLHLMLKRTTWPRAFQLKIKSLVLCKVSSCSGQGKAVMQLKTFVNMIWKLIWPWKIKKSCSFGKCARVELAESCWVVWRTLGQQKVIHWSITAGAMWADASTFSSSLCFILVSLLDSNNWEMSSS